MPHFPVVRCVFASAFTFVLLLGLPVREPCASGWSIAALSIGHGPCWHPPFFIFPAPSGCRRPFILFPDRDSPSPIPPSYFFHSVLFGHLFVFPPDLRPNRISFGVLPQADTLSSSIILFHSGLSFSKTHSPKHNRSRLHDVFRYSSHSFFYLCFRCSSN